MHESSSKNRGDELALVRTDLANERTLLAYGRTALMVIATGVTLIKFFPESSLVRTSGWVLALIGSIVGMIGAVRFVSLHKRLRPTGDRESS